MLNIRELSQKKIYFASDVHLGAPYHVNPIEIEKKFVNWLDSIKDSAKVIYLLGDIFDFWFEYKKVVPRGFARFIGKLCELNDLGIHLHFITGNHDIWIFDYLPSETGIIVHKEPIILKIDGFRFFIAHGDGLTKHEKSYRRMKKLFQNRVAQWFFRWLHPDIGIKIAETWSKNSRKSNRGLNVCRNENEPLVIWANEFLQKHHFDFFIFGHRHIANDMKINNNSRVIFLGDWINHFTYGVWDGNNFELKNYE
ncbi:MAG: UDP-2,3-diacylglucosamine diphosphatase [Marinilabiliaceae bacterium]|nr:UDP-2,3-diacylglucosamine diphosphatase [Marinilabiliaceae bacterium]